MNNLSDLEVGKAGEHLVCFDLILQGHTAMLSDQGVAFDVIAVNGSKLIKIQVKTTREASILPQRNGEYRNYLFNVRRCGNGGRMSYLKDDVDIFALVCLSTREIGYVAATDAGQTMVFRAEGQRGTYYDEIMNERILLIKSMYDDGISKSNIAKELGLDKSYVGRVIAKKDTSYIKGKYLSDMTFQIACRRIEDAQRQNDMFIAPDPQIIAQENLFNC